MRNYNKVIDALIDKDPNARHERHYLRLNDTRYPETKMDETTGRSGAHPGYDRCRKALDEIVKGSRVESTMAICEGTRVMLMSNVDLRAGLVNGSCGTVTSFVKLQATAKELQFVDTGHFGLVFPRVTFDAAGPHPARTVTIVPTSWTRGEGGSAEGNNEESSHRNKKKKKKYLASSSQIPLLKCWAITVHKSQGLTVDRAEVDLSLSSIFEDGQAYVAVSRVRSHEGLSVLNYPPTQRDRMRIFRADKRALRYYDDLAMWKAEATAATAAAPPQPKHRPEVLPVFECARLLLAFSLGLLKAVNFEDASMCKSGISVPKPVIQGALSPQELSLYGSELVPGPLRLESCYIRRHIWTILRRLEFTAVDERSKMLSKTWNDCVDLYQESQNTSKGRSRLQQKVLTEPLCALKTLCELFLDSPIAVQGVHDPLHANAVYSAQSVATKNKEEAMGGVSGAMAGWSLEERKIERAKFTDETDTIEMIFRFHREEEELGRLENTGKENTTTQQNFAGNLKPKPSTQHPPPQKSTNQKSTIFPIMAAVRLVQRVKSGSLRSSVFSALAPQQQQLPPPQDLSSLESQLLGVPLTTASNAPSTAAPAPPAPAGRTSRSILGGSRAGGAQSSWLSPNRPPIQSTITTQPAGLGDLTNAPPKATAKKFGCEDDAAAASNVRATTGHIISLIESKNEGADLSIALYDLWYGTVASTSESEASAKDDATARMFRFRNIVTDSFVDMASVLPYTTDPLFLK